MSAKKEALYVLVDKDDNLVSDRLYCEEDVRQEAARRCTDRLVYYRPWVEHEQGVLL